MLLNNLARTLRDLHRLDEAGDYADLAYQKARAAGDQHIVSQALMARAGIERERADLRRAAAALEELEPRLQRMLPAGHIAFASLEMEKALLTRARGNLAGAVAAADRAIAIAEASRQRDEYLPRLLLRRSDIQLEIGRPEDARSDAARALRMAQEAIEPGTFSSAVGRAHLALARALLAQGDSGEARAAFASAHEQLEPTLGAAHPDTRDARRLTAEEMARR